MIALVLAALGGALLILLGWGWEGWMAARDRRRITPPGEFVPLREATLHAVLEGRRRSVAQPVVVLDGGLTHGTLTWPAVVRALGPDWLVLSFDRAGHLWSSRAQGRRDMEAHLADQRALLAGLHLAPPWLLVAHGSAGHVARLHAIRHPEDVSGLVLVETLTGDMAPSLVESAFARALRWKVPLARFGLWRLWRFRRGPRPLPSTGTEAGIRAASARFSQSFQALEAGRAELACLAADSRAVDSLPPPSQPCIVVAATQGAEAIPEGLAETEAQARALQAQRDLAARIPRAVLRLADGSDHDIPWQAPGVVAAAIRDLGEVASRRPR